MSGGSPLSYLNDFAFEMIARAELHERYPPIAESTSDHAEESSSALLLLALRHEAVLRRALERLAVRVDCLRRDAALR